MKRPELALFLFTCALGTCNLGRVSLEFFTRSPRGGWSLLNFFPGFIFSFPVIVPGSAPTTSTPRLAALAIFQVFPPLEWRSSTRSLSVWRGGSLFGPPSSKGLDPLLGGPVFCRGRVPVSAASSGAWLPSARFPGFPGGASQRLPHPLSTRLQP